MLADHFAERRDPARGVSQQGGGTRPAKGALVRLSDAKFESKADVVVVGAGAAGLCAALAAGEGGASTIVFERDAHALGDTGRSGGTIAAANTRVQRLQGIADSAKKFVADIVSRTGGAVDRAVAMAVARASGPTIDWLMDWHGLQFELEVVSLQGHSMPRAHVRRSETLGTSGLELSRALQRAASRQGVAVATGHRVISLVIDSRKTVRGVRVRTSRGRNHDVACGAAVLASGGFEGNRDLIRRHIPEMARGLSFGHPGNRGDSIRWGLELGTGLCDMGSYQGLGGVVLASRRSLWMLCMIGGGFQINSSGARFSNEVRGYSEQAADILAQPGGFVWSIHDARGHQVLHDFSRYREALAEGDFLQADSCEELAKMIRVPRDALLATVAEVMDLIAAKRHDRFGRTFSEHQPLTPPYYGVKVTGALFHTQGGVAIDATGRVLRRGGQPFANLLAAGGAARALSGPGSSGYLSGCGLTFAVTMGRLAGRTAANIAKQHR